MTFRWCTPSWKRWWSATSIVFISLPADRHSTRRKRRNIWQIAFPIFRFTPFPAGSSAITPRIASTIVARWLAFLTTVKPKRWSKRWNWVGPAARLLRHSPNARTARLPRRRNL